MTCKDCIHYDVCTECNEYDDFTGEPIVVDDLEERNSNHTDCEDFMDKTKFIELPCKVGENVWVIEYCRCGKYGYSDGECWKRTSKRTPKIYGKISETKYRKAVFRKNGSLFETEVKEVPNGTVCYLIKLKPFGIKMYNEIGKTVFLTREEAEKVFEERKKNESN